VYAYYLKQANPFSISPQSDQVVGAVIMWVLGSLVFLIPAVFVTLKLLRQEAASRV
jgi:cytochrome c oxidase assembly factor CtaG